MKYGKYLNHFNFKGKNIIVTGANSGIGFETSRYILYLKGNLIMACRDLTRAEIAKNKLFQEFPNSNIEIFLYDQADFESISNFVKVIKSKKWNIDGLVCNAGIYFPKKGVRTRDGFELTVGTNYLGESFLLDLMEDILSSNHTRVVVVTSLTAITSKYYNLEEIDKLSRNKVYAYSKLLLAKETYERVCNGRYEIVLFHPGVCSTNILFNKDTGLSSSFSRLGRKFLNLFVHSASKASLGIVYGLGCEYKPYLYIKPRGLFAISGYPVSKYMPKKFMSNGLIDKTREFTQKVGKDVISK